ncbi:MAG: NIPSNAP family protein [Sphingobacteriales bacterium]
MKQQINILLCSILLLPALVVLLSWSQPEKSSREFYQLTIYHYSNAEQEKILDDYLQNALIPALHRMDISNIGVFKANSNDTSADKALYVLITLNSLNAVTRLPAKLNAEKEYQSLGAAYLNAPYTAPPYTRIETILLQAFSLAPRLQLPALKAEKKDRVYELRSYESATEKIFKNKMHMFNEGDEIGLFKKLNFNAVFYSEVIAGSKMPNLMYMTSFENMADREAHWKSFDNDTTWKRLSSMPEYQNNISHIDVIFLHPVDYSDF